MAPSTPKAGVDTRAVSTSGHIHDDDDGGQTEISLEQIIEYLLASKRSLTSTEHVWRANELVTTARAALQGGVELGARTGFVRRALVEQFKVLQRVKHGVDHVGKQAHGEFELLLRELDAADARLQRTLNQLRETVVESAFRPPDEDRRTLFDFVDDEGVENVKAVVRTAIDQTQDAQQAFNDAGAVFQKDLDAVQTMLETSPTMASLNEGVPSPVPSLLHALESHATEMATGLESLVRHFDFCVSAIKHIEGGGAAAQNITGDMPVELDVHRSAHAAPPEPMSRSERAEMLRVLEKDAEELEDVVMEIRDRLTEMEAQAEAVTAHVDQLHHGYDHCVAAFHLLEDVGARLPGYVRASEDFRHRWDEEKRSIEQQMGELASLGDFYSNFLNAYDGLIVEVGRRRSVQMKMEAIVNDAIGKVDRLFEDDAAERDAFKEDHGIYLPADIWPGLVHPPLRFDVVPAGSETASIPNLPRKTIEQAVRRIEGRG
ncbi:MAG: autophagy protein 17 [Thelocarpon superellum]|nr:MAG: autophagy protein 17 [Thelocarpon superellum]